MIQTSNDSLRIRAGLRRWLSLLSPAKRLSLSHPISPAKRSPFIRETLFPLFALPLLFLLPGVCRGQNFASEIAEVKARRLEVSAQIETVAAMNAVRARAGLPLLAISPKLIVMAEAILQDRVSRNDGVWLPKPKSGLAETLASNLAIDSNFRVGGVALRLRRHPSDLIEGMLQGVGDSPDKAMVLGREFQTVGLARATSVRLKDTDWEFWTTVYSEEKPESECLIPISFPSEVAEPSNLIFPVLNGARWKDTFGKMIVGLKHAGQDLMAPKMTPLVACFDGVVQLKIAGSDAEMGGNSVSLNGDSGWLAVYAHLNSDAPGLKDGKGSAKYAFAPGLKSGDHVRAGQLLGYLGESGNARKSVPHCHFELIRKGAPVSSAAILNRATILKSPLPALPDIANSALKEGLIRNNQSRYDGIVLHSQPGKFTALVAWKQSQFSPVSVLKPARQIVVTLPTGFATLDRLHPGTRIFVVGSEESSGIRASLLVVRVRTTLTKRND